jgi:two-component system, LytTR family, response regulator
MRVLIVDDERPARERLRRLLAGNDDIEIVGEADHAEAALNQVLSLTPDAVFLDVQMPGQSGLDLAASLPEPAPMIVFVTAYDHYALQAFDAAAIDYLLKPVEPERLQRALQRLRQSAGRNRTSATPKPLHLLIPDRGRMHLINVAEITWLEAADNYVVVHTALGAPLMRRTLTGLLNDLGDGFVRTHRSAAVALTQVQQVQSRGRGDGVVVLHGGMAAPCSRQYRATLMARLEALGQ